MCKGSNFVVQLNCKSCTVKFPTIFLKVVKKKFAFKSFNVPTKTKITKE